MFWKSSVKFFCPQRASRAFNGTLTRRRFERTPTPSSERRFYGSAAAICGRSRKNKRPRPKKWALRPGVSGVQSAVTLSTCY